MLYCGCCGLSIMGVLYCGCCNGMLMILFVSDSPKHCMGIVMDKVLMMGDVSGCLVTSLTLTTANTRTINVALKR